MINTSTIAFKTALIYIAITILNVTVFNMMIWENQTGLIMENAIFNSLLTGSNLKYRIDNTIENTKSITAVNLNKILSECSVLGIRNITIFSETGKIFISINNNKKANKTKATIEDLKMINTAITKQSFEDKLFSHKILKDEKMIELFIPFIYESDKNGIAAIKLEMKDISRQYGYLLRQCLFITLLIIIIHALFAIAILKMLIIPLRTLLGATRAISRGELNIRVPIVGQ
ncbi:MAG: hypothetical protein PVI26_14535, partial [Chitinispirillia bacterium]